MLPRYGYPDDNYPSTHCLTIPSTPPIPNNIPKVSRPRAESFSSTSSTPHEKSDDLARRQDLEKPVEDSCGVTPISIHLLVPILLYLQHEHDCNKTCSTCMLIKRQFKEIIEQEIKSSGTKPGHKKLLQRQRGHRMLQQRLKNPHYHLRRQRSLSVPHLHDEELTFSNTKLEDDEITPVLTSDSDSTNDSRTSSRFDSIPRLHLEHPLTVKSSSPKIYTPLHLRESRGDQRKTLFSSPGNNYPAHNETTVYFQNSLPRNDFHYNSGNYHIPYQKNIILPNENSSCTPV